MGPCQMLLTTQNTDNKDDLSILQGKAWREKPTRLIEAALWLHSWPLIHRGYVPRQQDARNYGEHQSLKLKALSTLTKQGWHTRAITCSLSWESSTNKFLFPSLQFQRRFILTIDPHNLGIHTFFLLSRKSMLFHLKETSHGFSLACPKCSITALVLGDHG